MVEVARAGFASGEKINIDLVLAAADPMESGMSASALQSSFIQEPQPEPGRLVCTSTDKIVGVFGSGLWTVQMIDDHFGRFDALLKESRVRHGRALVLVDVRNAAPQKLEVSGRLEWWMERIYQPSDRVAMVVVSSLVKAQKRRIQVGATREMFLSMSAATTWLMAVAD